jgi:catechol 2,3-dioxygenase-like lactoylglutathione lyase family enzyme
MPTNIGHRVLPCLLVSDMRRSLDFYVETLGFTQTGYYPIESDPIRTEVRRDDVAIILYSEAVHGQDLSPTFTGALYIFPEDIDPLADELRGRVPFAWGPEETELGIREFAIRDPDGYTFIFAERA